MEGPSSSVAPFSILVVEDEYLIGMELRDQLQDGGYDVIGPAATVAAALALLNKQRPHACLLDVNLRGVHSAPVAQALKERNVPFLLASAFGQETLDQHVEFRGVPNIGKLPSSTVLLSALAALLEA